MLVVDELLGEKGLFLPSTIWNHLPPVRSMCEVEGALTPSASYLSGEEEEGGALSSSLGSVTSLHLVQIKTPKPWRNRNGASQQVVFTGIDMTNMVGEVVAGVEVNKVNG